MMQPRWPGGAGSGVAPRVIAVVRVACLAGAGVLTLAPAARADPPSDPALIWQAPDSCPDAGEVRARIERRLGAPVDRVVRGVAVDVAVHREGREPRFVARIDLRGLRGGRSASAADDIRVLTSARCDELTDAVAVVIARIAAENDAPAPEAQRDGPVLARARSGAAAPRSWGGGLRALGLSGIGALPGVSVGGELAGHVRARWLVAELAAMGWVGSSRLMTAGGTARIDVGLRLAALRIGWGPEHLPLRAWLTGELGALRGEGGGLADPGSDAGRWIALGTGFAVAWPMLTHARLVGTIELVVPVRPARFVLQDGSEIYRTGAATVRSGLGLEIGWR